MSRKILMAIAVVMLMLVAGCTGSREAEKGQAESPKLQQLTIGLMPDVDSIPFIIAKEKGYFEQEGVAVKLEHFKSAVERDSALQSGKLDGVVSDMLAAAFAREGGFDTVITSLTTGSYKLVVGKGQPISSVGDLKGHDVAISQNTIIDYVTDKIIQQQGLTAADIQRAVIPQIPTRLEMLQNGRVAAATLPEPLASIAVKNGAQVLASSDGLGLNPGVMLFVRKSTNEKEQEIQALYRAYGRAVDDLAAAPVDNYIDLLIDKGGFPPAVKGTLVLPAYKKALQPAAKDVEDVVDWLYERGLIKTKHAYQDLVDIRFVR